LYQLKRIALQERTALWVWKMALRDSRKSWKKLILLALSIFVGVAALVAIQSFGFNLQSDMDEEARTLLGADLQVRSNQPFSDEVQGWLGGLAEEQVQATYFVSMAAFPKRGDSRLVQVRALQPGYPFYGELVTEPAAAARTFQQTGGALVERSLMIQFDLQVGDTVKLGDHSFLLAGELLSTPGRTGLAGSVAPVVYIPFDWLEATGLIQKGSRVEYLRFAKTRNGIDLETELDVQDEWLREQRIDVETVAQRKEQLGAAYSNLTGFLNLVGFVALLLGCIGVASAVHLFVREKRSSIAVLRCLGASANTAFRIFLIQVGAVALLGSLLGALGGSLLQLGIPVLFQEFIPLDEVTRAVSPGAVLIGIAVGVLMALLFALIPLLSVRRVSPLSAIRAGFGTEAQTPFAERVGVGTAIALVIAGFSYWQTGTWAGLFFPVALGVALLILWGVTQGVVRGIRRLSLHRLPFVWRQSIANLQRPNNQTGTLLVTLGLGIAMLTTLFLVQQMLLQQVQFSAREDRPNMILFDIQPSQQAGVKEMVLENRLPILQEVPIVTLRLESLRGKSRVAYLRDSSKQVPDWVLNREYRVTYRDSLISSESLLSGDFTGNYEGGGAIPISVATNIAEDMGVEVGDEIEFDLQGVRLKTVVGSLREVDFQRIQTNFMVVFPEGVLEEAPQFHVVISRADSMTQAADFQRQLVKAYPNVSVVDLRLILEAVDEIVGKVSFVIRFMALFSILTGLLVLVGTTLLSRYQRIRESVLLRTMGAARRQVLRINLLEYLLLGTIAGLSGAGIALLAGWGLAVFQFELPFTPDLLPVGSLLVILIVIVVLIGMGNMRSLLNRPPLAVLRRQ
jgi:putative ABC transport system permease protein